MRACDLLEEYFKRTKMCRTDLVELCEFDKARSSGSTPDGVKLFWDMWRPQYVALGEGSLRDLDSDIEDAVLEELARLERKCKIPYVPDDDLVEEHLEAAIQYVHVGAASALRRRKRDGRTEDVVDTLQEVSRILHLVGVRYNRNRLAVSYLAEAPHDFVSQFGVRSLVLSELAKSRSFDGKYEEAFEMAFDSFVCAEAVWDVVTLDREFLTEEFGEEILALEVETRDAIRKCLPLQNPQQVVDCFEELKRVDKSDNWRLVARQCARLARTIDEDLRELSVLDGNHQEINWYGYWCVAEGWASAQLSQKEYLKLRRQDERDASEERLRRYFFGGSWENIPERARGRLINADHLWFSHARGAAIDAVLNDLQVAAQFMCHAFIWEPLNLAKGGQELLEFKKKENELNDKNRIPTLYDYAWVCGRPFFKVFVQRLGLSEEEQQFLISDLGVDLDFLRRGRVVAEKDPNRRLRPDDTQRLVKLFLGIGEPGVLRRLAEVGPKLTGRRSRRL